MIQDEVDLQVLLQSYRPLSCCNNICHILEYVGFSICLIMLTNLMLFQTWNSSQIIVIAFDCICNKMSVDVINH